MAPAQMKSTGGYSRAFSFYDPNKLILLSFLAQARHGLPLNVVPLAFLTFYVAVTTNSLKLERLLPISI